MGVELPCFSFVVCCLLLITVWALQGEHPANMLPNMHVNVAPEGQPSAYEQVPIREPTFCPELANFRGVTYIFFLFSFFLFCSQGMLGLDLLDHLSVLQYSIQNQSNPVRAFYGLRDFFQKFRQGCTSQHDACEVKYLKLPVTCLHSSLLLNLFFFITVFTESCWSTASEVEAYESRDRTPVPCGG